MTIYRYSALILMFVGVAGCNVSDANVCSSISNFDVGKANDRSVTNLHPDPPESCVHRWAYRLASAQGSNLEIARAAVAACDEPIMYSALPADKSGPLAPQAYEEAVKQSRADMLEQALFRVVQARAGKCKVE